MTARNQPEPSVTGADAPVRNLMTRAVARIAPTALLNEAARKLAAVEAGALAVGSTTSLVGIVSERDVTRAYGRVANPAEVRVSDIASTELIWCDPDTTAARAAHLMCERGVRHLLVGDTDRSELEGIVSARVLLEALVGGLDPEMT